MKSPKRHKAMSLLISVAIVLLAFLLSPPKLWTPGQRGKSQIAKIQIKELEGGLQLFRYDIGRYPTTEDGLDALSRNPGLSAWRGPYLARPEVLNDPWGRPYVYRCPGQYGAYEAVSYGRDGRPSGEDEDTDVTSWDGGAGR